MFCLIEISLFPDPSDSASQIWYNIDSLYRYYTKAEKVLIQYKHMPSFKGIHEDCIIIVGELSQKLKEKFREKDVSYLAFIL